MSAGNEPAFPRQLNENGHSGQPGLTRRAWIASHALSGVLANSGTQVAIGNPDEVAALASAVFIIADAMIAEGEKS